MSRLDAVVRVLKATGKALHYDIITRQALQQGIIRFTGSQGTAGESMKAFLNKTIRENKSAAIMNMGKGVYGLKEWGRSGQSKELKQASPEAGPGPAARTASTSSSSSKTNAPGSSPVSPALTAATADELKSVSTSPASSKLLPGGPNQLLAGRDGCRSVEEAADSNTLPALVLAEPDQGSLEYSSVKSAGVKEDGKDYCAAGTRGKADIASILS